MSRKQSLIKDKYFLLTLVFLVISVAGAYFGIRYLTTRTGGDPVASQICLSERPAKIDTAFLNDYTDDHPWWNDEFSNFKQITVENNNSSNALLESCHLIIQFDHSLFVQDKRSKADGDDLTLLYYENSEYKEVPTIISDTNTSKIKITFLPVHELESGQSDGNYFLYYGNSAAKKEKAPAAEEETMYAQNYRIHINREVYPKISGKVSRQWLIKDTKVDADYTRLTYTIEIDESIPPDSEPAYKIIGTDKKGTLEKIYKGEYEVRINTEDLPIGSYQIQTTVVSGGKEYQSVKTHIFVSYPLYVVWTMDWEGTGVPNEELSNMDEFSNKHDTPITHFFTPRIFLYSEVTKDEVAYLTQWAQVRQINGDEIGIHLHMHHDMVRAAGVTPRTSPKWTDYLNNGHDVPCSAYTKEEFSKILIWAKQAMLDEGLGVPTSFRAGGWFTDLKVLQALDENGFIIESSGRDSYIWGANRLSGYWSLSSTTHPYQPSRTNQNVTSANHFNLWEFPNNGSDSWFHNSDDLIARFNDNYHKTPLSEAQVLTYLSHPHQISKDIQVLEPTYNMIDKYLASTDQGPVIYTTLEKAYIDITN